MLHKFPVGLTIEKVRDVTTRANETFGTKIFIEADRGEFIIFNYVVSFGDVWKLWPGSNDQAILRECRGLTFNRQGRVVARKLHKFHNVNELPETAIDAIDWSRSHVILEKLDGSMITPLMVERNGAWDVRWCTKLGMTEVADKVYPFVDAHPEYARFAVHCLGHDWTPIFEFCSRRQRIVIDYPEDRRIARNPRQSHWGLYCLRSHGVACRGVWHRGGRCAPPGLSDRCRRVPGEREGLVGVEGFIPRFDDGHMVKIKADEYCLIHPHDERHHLGEKRPGIGPGGRARRRLAVAPGGRPAAHRGVRGGLPSRSGDDCSARLRGGRQGAGLDRGRCPAVRAGKSSPAIPAISNGRYFGRSGAKTPFRCCVKWWRSIWGLGRASTAYAASGAATGGITAPPLVRDSTKANGSTDG
jgi:hypothetical protein